MNSEKYSGVIPALYACYDNEVRVSIPGTKALVRHLAEKGVRGLYVNGSSGECIYLSKRERKQILEAVMEEVPSDFTVIAHVACNNTADSCELAAHAEALGVTAIAAIPPIYFHLPEHSIAAYWNAISDAAPHTDFFIYNIPQLAGVALSPSLLREMLKNPRVAGVKNSSMASYDIEMWKRIGGKDFTVLNGPDEQFVSGRAAGASGGIGGTYAAMPEFFLAMDSLFKAGKFAEALEIQHTVNTLIEEMCACTGNLYAVLKEILRLNAGIDCGGVRAPLENLAEEDREKAAEIAGKIRKYRKV